MDRRPAAIESIWAPMGHGLSQDSITKEPIYRFLVTMYGEPGRVGSELGSAAGDMFLYMDGKAEHILIGIRNG